MAERDRAAHAPSRLVDLLLCLALALVAAALVHGGWGRTTQWPPDALFYEARVLELRGADADAALQEVLDGPLAEGVSDVVRNPEWVAFNKDLYRPRVVVPALAAVVEPAAGTDSLQLVALSPPCSSS